MILFADDRHRLPLMTVSVLEQLDPFFAGVRTVDEGISRLPFEARGPARRMIDSTADFLGVPLEPLTSPPAGYL